MKIQPAHNSQRSPVEPLAILVCAVVAEALGLAQESGHQNKMDEHDLSNRYQ
jgi:hypothetical protein